MRGAGRLPWAVCSRVLDARPAHHCGTESGEGYEVSLVSQVRHTASGQSSEVGDVEGVWEGFLEEVGIEMGPERGAS